MVAEAGEGPADETGGARRLEQLWGGSFGDEYVDRNMGAYASRSGFWAETVRRTGCRSVLEVGCNVGGNLRHIARHIDPGQVYGVDVNRHSLDLIHEYVPDAQVLVASARDLPFRDRWFDLTFTVGVLIHQPAETLDQVIRELVRCSSRYVLAVEIFAETETEIVHRGVERGLFKRDYGAQFLAAVPSLTMVDNGFLARDAGFDDLHWWLFEVAA